MVVETVTSYLNPDLYHRFFFFLSTTQGVLFERTIELVIFTILSYMVISEYLRSKKREMKYFIFAFGSIMVLRIFSVVLNFSLVFGDLNEKSLIMFIPVAVQFIEILAIILLINAFTYPILVKKVKKLDKLIISKIYIAIIISIIIQLIWMSDYHKYASFETHPGNILFILIKIVLILYTLFLIVHFSNIKFRYRLNVFIAFSIYLITPILQLVNMVIFDYGGTRLQLFELPFPLIAILLLTRIIYLKLVDKAYLQERLRESEKKYLAEKHLSEMKDEFVSVVSHELRTPITSMKLYCGLIHNEKFGKITDKQHQAIHIIESECNRLNTLINDILNLSKLESGKDKLHLGKFNVSELKDLIINNSAKQKDIKLKINIPEDLVVYADKEKIEQLYINLLSNAVKFTDKKGSIEVAVSKNTKTWKLSVKDTGKGIPEKEIPKLFDKFYQAESHMTRSIGGTGLGLAIVKSIVELHRGTIEVWSKPGEGSKFVVKIPKSQ